MFRITVAFLVAVLLSNAVTISAVSNCGAERSQLETEYTALVMNFAKEHSAGVNMQKLVDRFNDLRNQYLEAQGWDHFDQQLTEWDLNVIEALARSSDRNDHQARELAIAYGDHMKLEALCANQKNKTKIRNEMQVMLHLAKVYKSIDKKLDLVKYVERLQ